MSGYNGYPVVFGIGKTYGGMPSIADFAFTTTPTTVNVPKAKALLDNQLKLVKNLKTSIIEMSQREMQLFNAFKEASAKNPSLTYDKFIKTMK